MRALVSRAKRETRGESGGRRPAREAGAGTDSRQSMAALGSARLGAAVHSRLARDSTAFVEVNDAVPRPTPRVAKPVREAKIRTGYLIYTYARVKLPLSLACAMTPLYRVSRTARHGPYLDIASRFFRRFVDSVSSRIIALSRDDRTVLHVSYGDTIN